MFIWLWVIIGIFEKLGSSLGKGVVVAGDVCMFAWKFHIKCLATHCFIADARNNASNFSLVIFTLRYQCSPTAARGARKVYSKL